MVHASVAPSWSLAELETVAREVEERLRGRSKKCARFWPPRPIRPTDHLGRLTRCRSVGAKGVWSADEPVGKERAWHEAWREHEHDYGVVYGHWAMQGLHKAKALRGIDTGCVHHGRGRDGYLTDGSRISRASVRSICPTKRFWSVPARRAYYAHRDAKA
jgi:hypothetical protein